MNKTLKRIIYILLVLIVIFIAAYPKLDLGKDNENQKQSATPARPTLTLEASEVAFEKLDYIVNVTGTVVADENVDLNAEVSGKVEAIRFEEGQDVKKGQLLLSLNDDELQAELKKLEFTQKLNQDNEYRQKKLLEKQIMICLGL